MLTTHCVQDLTLGLRGVSVHSSLPLWEASSSHYKEHAYRDLA